MTCCSSLMNCLVAAYAVCGIVQFIMGAPLHHYSTILLSSPQSLLYSIMERQCNLSPLKMTKKKHPLQPLWKHPHSQRAAYYSNKSVITWVPVNEFAEVCCAKNFDPSPPLNCVLYKLILSIQFWQHEYSSWKCR